MHSFKTIFGHNMRRAGTVIGLAFFVFFVYRASHDVSSVKIAAGAQRKQAASAIGRKNAELNVSPPNSEPAVAILTNPETAPAVSVQLVNGGKPTTDSAEVARSLENDKVIKTYTKPIKSELNSNPQNIKPDKL